MSARFSSFIAVLALIASVWLQVPVTAAAEPLARWQRHDPAAVRTVDHGGWAGFLARYRVADGDGIARLRYAAVTPADREALERYIAGLEAVGVEALDRREQLAFWVNLYNAVTVRIVLDHYPVRSIRDISLGGGLFRAGPWSAKVVAVGGERLSLDDIEHRILRPLWRDPRIHYVVNCASLSCPDLPPAPLTGANAEATLEAAARAYVNHPRGARVRDGRLVASRIYRWYREDFGGSEAGVLAHLRRYAAPPLAALLAGPSAVERYEYDWSLNDASTAPER